MSCSTLTSQTRSRSTNLLDDLDDLIREALAVWAHIATCAIGEKRGSLVKSSTHDCVPRSEWVAERLSNSHRSQLNSTPPRNVLHREVSCVKYCTSQLHIVNCW